MGILLQYAGLRWLWIGQLLSQLGNAVFLIMGLWEIQLRSPYLLSVAGLAMVIPTLLAALGGALVDRYDAARMMLWTDILRGVAVAAGIAALLIPGSLVAVVIVLLGVNSLGVSLFGPAESLVVPRLVRDADLPAANGVYNLTGQISGAVGSALGGAAIAALGVGIVFGLDMVSFWISALAIWLMIRIVTVRAPQPANPAEDAAHRLEDQKAERREPQGGFIGSLRDGFVALRKLPAILPLLPLILLANFAFTAAFTILPFWIRGTLHASALSYGLIDAGWAAGLVLGSMSTGYFRNWPLRLSAAVMFSLQGIVIAAFAFSLSVPVSGSLLLLAGVFNGIGNALTFTMLQRLTPEAVRGRVFGLMFTLFGLANPLGALAASLFIHGLPIAWSWIFAGMASLAGGIGMWLIIPRDMGMPEVPASGD